MKTANLQFAALNIELTRRCNLACSHCMRGDSQNKTITKEIIDRLFHNLTTVVQLGITGGEVLLEPEMLLYTIHKMAKVQHVYMLTTTTNGSVLDHRVIDAMEEFCMTPDSMFGKRKATLAISKDQYHTGVDYDAAATFYTELANQANERIRNALGEAEDEPPAINIDINDNATKMMLYSGRAVNVVDNNREQYRLGNNLRTKSLTPHRIKIKDGVVRCSIGITTDGNVTIDDEGSWDDVDNSTIGNLDNNSLRYLIERHNDQCLLTCTESSILDMADLIKVATADEMPLVEKIMKIFTLELAQTILGIRQMIRKTHRMLPACLIIDTINMPLNYFDLAIYISKMEAANRDRDLQDMSKTLGDGLFNELATYLQTATPDEANDILYAAKALDYLRRKGDKYVINKFKKYFLTLKVDERAYCLKAIRGDTLPDNSKCYTCLDDGGDVFQDYGFYGIP